MREVLQGLKPSLHVTTFKVLGPVYFEFVAPTSSRQCMVYNRLGKICLSPTKCPMFVLEASGLELVSRLRTSGAWHGCGCDHEAHALPGAHNSWMHSKLESMRPVSDLGSCRRIGSGSVHDCRVLTEAC